MEEQFLYAFQAMQQDMSQINKDHGFNEIDTWIKELSEVEDPRVQRLLPAIKNARVGLKLMLVVSELAEALESLRKGNPPDSHIPEFSGVEAEIADASIRLMNLATDEGYRFPEAILEKNEYNRNRPYKHGGKVF